LALATGGGRDGGVRDRSGGFDMDALMRWLRAGGGLLLVTEATELAVPVSPSDQSSSESPPAVSLLFVLVLVFAALSSMLVLNPPLDSLAGGWDWAFGSISLLVRDSESLAAFSFIASKMLPLELMLAL
jgi:hypothetical protein